MNQTNRSARFQEFKEVEQLKRMLKRSDWGKPQSGDDFMDVDGAGGLPRHAHERPGPSTKGGSGEEESRPFTVASGQRDTLWGDCAMLTTSHVVSAVLVIG